MDGMEERAVLASDFPIPEFLLTHVALVLFSLAALACLLFPEA
jgi:hypothetical protein